MRRKLWLLLILFLFLVGRESCCASQEQPFFTREDIQALQALNEEPQEEEQSGGGNSVLNFIIDVCLTSFVYRYFDLHQKEKGWYACKFFYAAGYRTKLFYKRVYFDFYSSFPRMILPSLCVSIPLMSKGLYKACLLLVLSLSFFININIRIKPDFYIVIPIVVLPIILFSVVRIASLLKK